MFFVSLKIFIAVSDIPAPPPEYDGRVNMKDFWESVTAEIVCQGLLGSKELFCLLELDISCIMHSFNCNYFTIIALH